MRTLLLMVLLTSTTQDATADTPEVTLADLIRDARAHELSLAASNQDIEVSRAARDTRAGALWPRLEARFAYTRNQHDAVVTLPDGDSTQRITITPFDQLEASATLTVPILDLGLRRRLTAHDTRIGAQVEQQQARVRSIDERVATAFFQLYLAERHRQIATAEVELSVSRVHETAARKQAGFANPLAMENAHADLALAQRTLARADYEAGLARLDLAELTGHSAEHIKLAEFGPPSPVPHDVRDVLDTRPEVRAARSEARAHRQDAEAARLDLVPTVEAFVSDRLSNAAGFGEVNNLSAGLSARFLLDAPTLRRRDEALANARAAELKAMVALRDAETHIRRLQLELAHKEAILEAARTEVTARDAASTEAALRHKEGLATRLDLTIAERDRHTAWLELARAEADLRLTHALLVIAAGGTP